MAETPPRGSRVPWNALFQRSSDPLFLLSRQRRLLLVNSAWETMTGIALTQVRGMACTRRTPAGTGSLDALARALCPPAEVLKGQPTRVHRLFYPEKKPSVSWDLTFFPLVNAKKKLRILGRITLRAASEATASPPLSDRLIAIREGRAARFQYQPSSEESPVLARVRRQVYLASQSHAPLLLIGEPGAGKNWTAQTIHYLGISNDKVFAAVNCANLPNDALEFALFGDRGHFRQQTLGTIYFREPASLHRDLQVRIADWIREASAGGPRLVAGCCIDPALDVQQGRLSRELFCGLAVQTIAVPPLRERSGELPWLVENFLERLTSRDEGPTGLTTAAWEMFRAYPWPGNLRELFAVLRSSYQRCQGKPIDASDLPSYVRTAVTLARTPPREPERILELDHLLEQAERRLIVIALRRARGNKSRAAELLSIWRPRLIRRMEALGIKDCEIYGESRSSDSAKTDNAKGSKTAE